MPLHNITFNSVVLNDEHFQIINRLAYTIARHSETAGSLDDKTWQFESEDSR